MDIMLAYAHHGQHSLLTATAAGLQPYQMACGLADVGTG